MNRGQVQLTDVIAGLLVLVALLTLAPFFYTFIGMASAEADPFTRTLMQLIVPVMFVGLVISIAVSAR